MPPGYHLVEQGEYLSKIARGYGVPKWQSIWDHPQNKELRELRENPEILHPGDEVFIPMPETKVESGATEQRHRFVLHSAHIELALIIQDENTKARRKESFIMIVDGETFSNLEIRGTLDNEGMLRCDLPSDTERCLLRVGKLVYHLQVGHLDPVDTLTGQQQRLKNLGYHHGLEHSDEQEVSHADAIKLFQADHHLQVDGICGPATQTKLLKIHGC